MSQSSDAFETNQFSVLNHEKLLAEQIKRLEGIFEQKLDPSKPFVIRIDGVAFRTYTRGFKKPFDQRMTRAFIRTAADLLQRFNPSTVYYASDEISLVFNACPNATKAESKAPEHSYSGRIQKLVSVVASFAAAKFNQYINEEDWSDLDKDHVRQRLANHSAYFDARVFSMPNDFGTMAAIYWRHHYDTLKNATSSYALSFYSAAEISGKNSTQLKEMMANDHGWDMINQAPRNILYGTFLKREIFDLPAIDRKTSESIVVQRTRIRIGSFNLDEIFTTIEEKINFIRSKYWNESGEKNDSIEIPDWWMKYYRQVDPSI